VWGDDLVRWDRLRLAIALARAEPVGVRACPGPDFLAADLARPQPGALTMVWHSVVWQHVSDDGRFRFELRLRVWPHRPQMQMLDTAAGMASRSPGAEGSGHSQRLRRNARNSEAQTTAITASTT